MPCSPWESLPGQGLLETSVTAPHPVSCAERTVWTYEGTRGPVGGGAGLAPTSWQSQSLRH